MKKTLIAAALLASTTAFAGVTGFATYDFDRANSGQGFSTMNEVQFGAALDTTLGTVDGSVVTRQLSPAHGTRDHGVGFEVGYTNGVKLGAVSVKGRAAVGRVNDVQLNTIGFKGNTQYYSLAAEASIPVAQGVSAFAGYRARDAFNGTGPVQHRVTVGADLAVTQSISVRAGYAYTRQDSVDFNGLTTAVSVKF